MISHWRRFTLAAASVFFLPSLMAGSMHARMAHTSDKSDAKDIKRPSLTLRASPSISFSPAKVFLIAELRGGPNDYEEYYCASVEWDWGDGTRSESTYDCEPYEPGKSEIKRRFAIEHIFQLAGNYRIQFRLKKQNKAVAGATANVQVRPGFRDPGIGPS